MKRQLILLIILAMLIGSLPAVSAAVPEDTIALHIGSPLILSDGSMKSLDSENPNVVPVIHKDRTLVPLRAISEHFGAEVGYDEVNREASIKYSGKTYYFPIGKNIYRISEPGKQARTITYDTEALIIESRTMVPLRLIAEEILGKDVGYRDRTITIGKGSTEIDDEMLAEIKVRIGQVLKPRSREELKALLAAMQGPAFTNDQKEAAPLPAQEAPVSEVDRGSDDFSSTNEQVAGVNEADVVKTDGRFIYVVTGKSIRLYDSNNGRPILTDSIEVKVDEKTGQYIQFRELFIHEGKLIVLGDKGSFNNWIRPMPEVMDGRSIMPYYERNESFVYAGVYSVSSNGKLELERELEIEGSLLSSRKKDNTLYLMINQYAYNYWAVDDTITPRFMDSADGDTIQELSIDNILYFPRKAGNNYLLIAALDVTQPDDPANIQAFLGSGSQVYMSSEAVYVAAQDYNTIWGSITNVAKFKVNGSKIAFAGGGMVDGTILNQFSMDEHEGNLRIATTNWQQESINAVYILDKDLNQIGALENLAPGERIFSTRFMGDYGYMVTFRQVDPLFVLDLSDPMKPRVTGELKIPGFSSYLHPISDTVLLGIGRDVDENTGSQNGIKLSLFDVSDLGKPRELDTLILGGPGSYAEVLDNHKALMLNLGDDMIAFDASLTDITDKYVKTSFDGAAVVEVKAEGSIKVLKLISNDGIYGSYAKRLVYIGDRLYYVLDETIRVFDMNDFSEIK